LALLKQVHDYKVAHILPKKIKILPGESKILSIVL